MFNTIVTSFFNTTSSIISNLPELLPEDNASMEEDSTRDAVIALGLNAFAIFYLIYHECIVRREERVDPSEVRLLAGIVSLERAQQRQRMILLGEGQASLEARGTLEEIERAQMGGFPVVLQEARERYQDQRRAALSTGRFCYPKSGPQK